METSELRQEVAAARTLFKEMKYSEAFIGFLKLHSKGNITASSYLGYMYEHGLGMAVDKDEALRIYREASDRGSERAQLMCASLLRSMSEYAESTRLYAKLSENGNPSAKYWMYICFRDGLGYTKDMQQSDAYLKQAAEAGHLYAMRDLSKQYLRGEHGFIGIFKGIAMSFSAIARSANALANDPDGDKLH